MPNRLPTKASLSMAAAIVFITALVPTARAGRVPPPAALRYHYVVAPTGNEARYRVREVLVGVDFPNDAVGVTHNITGTLVVDTTGRAVEDSSKIIVDVSVLKSDKDKRDDRVRKNILETNKVPTVEIVPSFIKGITGVPPASGTRVIELVGNLKVHGVTRPTSWHGTATFAGDDLSGKITTAFTFAEIGLKQPSVAIVLSVEDTIKLEYDFHMIKK